MKYGDGLVTGSFVMARRRRTNGSEAASAGIFRRAFWDSGKKRWAAKSEAEKKNTPEPAATTRKLRKSRSPGPTEIQRKAARNVRTTAIAMAARERRTIATRIAIRSRRRRPTQTGAEV